MIGKGRDCLNPVYIKIDGYSERLRVRCGRCIYCKMQRSMDWCVRLELEAKYWNNISFVTMTYADENLPFDYWQSAIFEDEEEQEENGGFFVSTLFKRDVQLFVKRLRKFEKNYVRYFNFSGKRASLRYYAVGEYGTRGTRRPHYHMILFGMGQTTEEQEFIKKCWGKGWCTVDPFYPETCAYVAGYVQKKLYHGRNELDIRRPEFSVGSHYLGLEWLLEHEYMFDDEHTYININGYKHNLPRYFRNVLTERGRLSPHEPIEFALQQLLDYKHLKESLDAKNHSSMDDFFRQRYKDAVEKEKRKNRKRDYTGDNFL